MTPCGSVRNQLKLHRAKNHYDQQNKEIKALIRRGDAVDREHHCFTLKELLVLDARLCIMNYQNIFLRAGTYIYQMPYQPSVLTNKTFHLMENFCKLPLDLKIEIIFDTLQKSRETCSSVGHFTYTIRFMNCSLYFVQLFDQLFFEKVLKAIAYLYEAHSTADEVKRGAFTMKLSSLLNNLDRNLEMRELFYEDWTVNEFKNLREAHWKQFYGLLKPPPFPSSIVIETDSENSPQNSISTATPSVSTFVSEQINESSGNDRAEYIVFESDSE